MNTLGTTVVTGAASGLADTPMLAGLGPTAHDQPAATAPPSHRLGAPAEFAQLVHTIIENYYLNGKTIPWTELSAWACAEGAGC